MLDGDPQLLSAPSVRTVRAPFLPLDQGVPFQLSYYDSKTDSFEWIADGIYNPYLTVVVGERFTLSSSSGYVDSVVMMIDSIDADSTMVALMPDTLYNVGGGFSYHLINVFGAPTLTAFPNRAFGKAWVDSQHVHWGTWTTVRFPHVKVPGSFFVTVIPEITPSNSLANAAWWRGDVEAARTITSDNARSAFVGVVIQSGQAGSYILDGTFKRQSDGQFLYTNLYATLFGTQGASEVPFVASTVPSVRLWPNPASALLRVDDASSLELMDMLGRSVLHSEVGSKGTVDVSRIPTGRYEAILRSANGVSTSSLVIAR